MYSGVCTKQGREWKVVVLWGEPRESMEMELLVGRGRVVVGGRQCHNDDATRPRPRFLVAEQQRFRF